MEGSCDVLLEGSRASGPMGLEVEGFRVEGVEGSRIAGLQLKT